MSLLSNLFDIARTEWGVCTSNPVSAVRKPKPPPGRSRRLSSGEERRIRRYCLGYRNRELHSIVTLAIETAMRSGEILSLQWEFVDLRSRIAILPDTKNGTRRDVPLSLAARDALARLAPKPCGPVFSYSAHGLKSAWRTMMRSLSIIDLHFHDLRHEAVSRLFELGTLDLMEVSAISGHKSLSMLKRYTHLKAQRLVHKLEGKKTRLRGAVIGLLAPYPATIVSEGGSVVLEFPDFPGFSVRAEDMRLARVAAEHALLVRLLRMLRSGSPIPRPGDLLGELDAPVIMVDPLPPES